MAHRSGLSRRPHPLWLATLIVSLVLSALSPVAHAQESGVSIDHVPNARAVAGDELGVAAQVTPSCAATAVCTQPMLTAHYVDVDQQEKSVVGAADGVGGPLTVAIPGKDVRFPSVSYWLEASVVERPVGVTEETCSVQPSACRRLTARSPATGMHTTQVDNVVRLGFQRPDGTPAAGVRVLATPPPRCGSR